MLSNENLVMLLVDAVGAMDAARSLDVSRQTIWRWTRGGTTPSMSANRKAAMILKDLSERAQERAASAQQTITEGPCSEEGTCNG